MDENNIKFYSAFHIFLRWLPHKCSTAIHSRLALQHTMISNRKHMATLFNVCGINTLIAGSYSFTLVAQTLATAILTQLPCIFTLTTRIFTFIFLCTAAPNMITYFFCLYGCSYNISFFMGRLFFNWYYLYTRREVTFFSSRFSISLLPVETTKISFFLVLLLLVMVVVRTHLLGSSIL